MHTLTGTVIHGTHHGTPLGFPTINLETVDPLPPHGIYAGKALVNKAEYLAAIHVGPVPVFHDENPRIEAFLLDFEGDLYGKSVTIQCIEKLRDVQNFPTLPELQKQITLDVARVRELLT